MLNISPKLAPCIHTVFLFSGLFEKKQNFSLNLFGSSFPDKILIKKIKGDNKRNIKPNNS